MSESHRSTGTGNSNFAVENAKNRCRSVIDRIQALPPSRITESCKRTLLRLVNGELKFLSRLTFPPDLSHPLSVNIGYLESVVHILQQPSVSGVSRVCKAVPLLSQQRDRSDYLPKGIHIDIVGSFRENPVWFIVSDRNPRNISWSGSQKNKGLKRRVQEVLDAARSTVSLKPTFIVIFFSKGIDEVISEKLRIEFEASEFGTGVSFTESDIFEEVEGEWVYITRTTKSSAGSIDTDSCKTYCGARAFQIKLNYVDSKGMMSDHMAKDWNLGISQSKLSESKTGFISNDAFCSVISSMGTNVTDGLNSTMDSMLDKVFINFDTTALVALVSGISNGSTEQLLKATDDEMQVRFKGNVKFIMEQVTFELQSPILVDLKGVISGKKGIICKSVDSEFKELVSMYGGPKEKARADQLLDILLVVPDCPSERMVALPTTRKIALKNKIIFGTGDHWRAPTLTANVGFVRAISQTGMSLLTLEHRPRALVGD